ncbi:MAG TPA: MmcQ/YjbR family DNA-binding protein [Gemmatimonadaceae bacterium]|nr:MmcQ/YjbR family DNA-binding protein [Gemmatimonadaceae bacterium]
MKAKQAGQRKKAKRAKKPLTPLDQLRSVCLALPEAHEVEAWGEPTFRIRNKLFAMYASEGTHHTDGRPSVWVKSTAVNQDLLIRERPDRFFSPPYVGPSGWVGIYLDKRPSWKEVAEIIRDGYNLIAPRRRAAR